MLESEISSEDHPQPSLPREEPGGVEGYRLSPQQDRVWCLQADSAAHHARMAVRIEGPLDEDRLRAAVQEIVERHEILRTTFRRWVADEPPLQVVHESLDPEWRRLDLGHLEPAQQGARIESYLEVEGLRPFQLERGPLLRLALLDLGRDRRVLTLHLPALCADLQTLENLFAEIVRCYQPHDEPAKHTNPMPYAQFSEWQKQLLELGQEETDHWKRIDFDAVLGLELPFAGPEHGTGYGDDEEPFRPGRLTCRLPPQASRAAQELVGERGTSLRALFLAGFLALLRRLSGRNRVGTGVCAAGRSYNDLVDSLGAFEKAVPLELELRGTEPFGALLERVDAALEEAADWQEYFDWAAALEPRPGPERIPACFDSVRRRSSPCGGEVSFTAAARYACLERFLVKLTVVETIDTSAPLELELVYDARGYREEAARRLLLEVENLVREAVRDPGRSLDDLGARPPAERQLRLAELNDTARRWPRMPPVPRAIEEVAAEHPQRTAVEIGRERLSYGELNARANQLARRLRRLGAAPDTLVAIALERSLELVVALVGVLKAGAAYLPIDPEYPRERRELMLSDSRVRLLVVSSGQEPVVGASEVRTLGLDPSWASVAEEDPRNLEAGPRLAQLAYGIYTSGSTGRPKAALNSHGALANRLLWMQEEMGLAADDRVMQKTPVSFDVSVWELFWPLVTGARLVLARPGGHRDPGYLAELIVRRSVTTVHFVPSMLRAFLEHPAAVTCQPLRRLVSSGEVLGPELGSRVRELLPRAALYNLYGPTEAAIDVTSWRWQGMPGRRVPIGRPIANASCQVLDRRLRPLPVGAVGELCLGGLALARGYLHQPGRTAERFVPDPVGGGRGERLYRTGDLCRWRVDGELELLGRADHQVKIRGFRVEPGEVEAALGAHAGVRASAVTAREESGGFRLVAYVVPRHAPGPTAEELRAFLADRLPAFLVPSVFVTLRKLPLLPNGKLDRTALPAPASVRSRSRRAPRNPVEEKLVEIWTAVLGVEEVGIDDDFLELGGDSILSLQIVAKANRAGIGLVPGEILQHRTVANLALAAGSHRAPPAEQEPLVGEVPLAPIQRWFFELELENSDHWNQGVLLEVRQPFPPGILEKAAERLEEHHDALRLRFGRHAGGWRQVCLAPSPGAPLVVADLSRLGSVDRGRQQRRLATRAQASLDLRQGPVWRLVLFQVGAAQRLLLTAHHLVVDGVSWRVLIEDLESLVTALEAGASLRPELPARTASVKRWVLSLGEHARSQDVVQQLDYWLALPWEEVTPLPTDAGAGRTANTVASARTRTYRLTEDQTAALLREVPRAYRTEINDVLLTALARAVSRWTGGSSLLVDLEGHGRQPVAEGLDASRTVGWFTSLFPVLLDLGQGTEPGSALVSVKEQLRQLPDGGLGWAMLRYLSAADDAAARLGELPRPEICFNYIGQFDAAMAASARFAPSAEPAGPSRSPKGRRPHLLEVDAGVWDGCLEVAWTYSSQCHLPATVDRVAERFLGALRALIGHCTGEDSTGYTSSDFALAGLDGPELDTLVCELGGGAVVDDIYPLATSQQGMLMFLLMEGEESGIFFNQLHCRLDGPLELATFQRVWQRVVDHHAILRTQLRWQGLPRPLQVVRDRVEPAWTVEDWRGAGAGDAAERLERFLARDRRERFDLTRAPLVRLALLRLADESCRFVLSYHHLILDGWSISLLLNQVLELYRGEVQGRLVALEEVPPYRGYVEWLGEQDEGAAEARWRRALAGFRQSTPLPVQRAEPLPGAGFGEIRRVLGTETTRQLGAVARGCRLTANTLVQGAWALLLHAVSGRREVVFGSVVSGRESGFDSTLGLFINALPVRAAIGEGPASRWLEGLQAEQAELRRFEHWPLEQIQRWSEVPRDEALFQTLLVFENYPVEEGLRGGEAAVRISGIEVVERTNYPLALFTFPGESYELALSFDASLFDPAAARCLLDRFEHLLVRLLERPEATPAELLAAGEEERGRLLAAGSAHGAGSESVLPVHRRFEIQALETPDAAAVVAAGRTTTYAELDRRSRALAHALTEGGAGPEEIVGVWLERSADMVAALVGTLRSGAAFLPLDSAWPPKRCRELLEDAGARLLLSQRELAAGEDLGEVEVVLAEEVGAAPEDGARGAAGGRGHLAYALYTSGSTGRPKGVLVEHGALARFVHEAAELYALRPGDRVLQFASPAFDTSIEEIFPALARGAAVVLRDEAMLASAESFFSTCAGLGVTVVDLPTAFWHRLVRELDDRVALPDRLRLVVLGGEQARASSLGEWRRRFPGAAPRLVNTYGPTEAAVVATRAEMGPLPAGAEVPIGAPLAHAAARVLDRRLEPVVEGLPGELLLGGSGLARGYLGRPALTAERFVPDPFRAGERLYRTGDLACWSAPGELRFLGRLDQQLKVRGYRVEPGEVEAVLRGQPAVADAVVVAGEDGRGDAHLVAYLEVCEGAAAPSPIELRVALRGLLPHFMVPAQYVVLPALPHTAGGKVDRRALPDPAAEASPASGAYTAPRNDAEEAVAEIFEDLLEVPRVGAFDNFFDLGGHSLLVPRLVAQVREIFEVDVPLRTVFASPTVAQLAAEVAQLILDELEAMPEADEELAAEAIAPPR